MTRKRELNIKPSCMSEIHGFPADQSSQLWEKINFLVEDPIPDGKLKKKLKGKKGVYRLRVGHFRVFYTFGDTWIRLLGIRRRDERTFRDKSAGVIADRPIDAPDNVNVDVDELEAAERSHPAFQFESEVITTPLPRRVTAEWLAELKVPAAYVAMLVACSSEEALLATEVPGEVLERIIDNLFPRPIEEVEQQPDLVFFDTEDLVKYKERGLVPFLLRLDEEQRVLTEFALKGPTMVKGGAGTGKSTVALYRVKTLLEKSNSSGNERVLFTTYTRALTSASRQLLEQLLEKNQLDRVRIATCDEVAREIVASSRRVGHLEFGSEALNVLRSVREGFEPSGPTAFDRKLRARMLQVVSDRYLLEEFDWIIDGRGLRSLEEYKQARRIGRGCRFSAGLRAAVWDLHQAYNGAMKAAGIERWAHLRSEALDLVNSDASAGRFDYVVVDEVQDLTPTALRLMADLAMEAEGLFFSSDTKQSLYSRNYTWAAAHPRLQFKGRTRTLKKNYRSTREIDEAAFEILVAEAGESMETSTAVRSGPTPVLLKGVPEDKEGVWTAKFVRQMSRHLRLKMSACAVLVPRRAIGERLAQQLSELGVRARFFSGQELDLKADVIKVLTLHSAKGLEFPVVVVCGFEPGTYPQRSNFSDDAVYDERMRNERRLLYVATSRAMRGLMVIVNQGCEHEALLELTAEHWHVENLG